MRHVRVAIIGSGFAGLCAAVQLARSGETDFVVIERASEVGGVWRDNTYPGAACDIRSDLYSFSFAPNPDWQRSYGQQPEILGYLRGVAERFGIAPRIEFGTELESANWDDATAAWTLTTSRGQLSADVVVAGHGPLIEPVWPTIPGLDAFDGPRFHSARWRHDVDLAGKRIAVIGTGASAIQFVPALQEVAASLVVFQRTPPWILPRSDRPTSDRRRRLFARSPLLQRLSRWWIFRQNELQFIGFRVRSVGRIVEALSARMMRSQVRDPDLRDKLTPGYRIGCKRILLSSRYYPALAAPNVDLVTERIVRVDGNAIVTADGSSRQFDVLVCGTGFDATHPPIAGIIHGRDGRSLADAWTPHMSALRGTTMAGFPNLFLLAGPNTLIGHNSLVYMIEAQVAYVIAALGALRASGARSIEPRREAQDRYNAALQRSLAGSVWLAGGCGSYYIDRAGRNTTVWPHRAGLFRRSVSRFRPEEYRFEGRAVTAPVAAAKP